MAFFTAVITQTLLCVPYRPFSIVVLAVVLYIALPGLLQHTHTTAQDEVPLLRGARGAFGSRPKCCLFCVKEFGFGVHANNGHLVSATFSIFYAFHGSHRPGR
jgi:hypothetical protein